MKIENINDLLDKFKSSLYQIEIINNRGDNFYVELVRNHLSFNTPDEIIINIKDRNKKIFLKKCIMHASDVTVCWDTWRAYVAHINRKKNWIEDKPVKKISCSNCKEEAFIKLLKYAKEKEFEVIVTKRDEQKYSNYCGRDDCSAPRYRKNSDLGTYYQTNSPYD